MGQNRLFIGAAVALVGLLILGLIGVGGVMILGRLRGQAAPTPIATATPTKIHTPTPTSIASPTPTSTPVVPAPTPTLIAPTPTPSKGGVPKTGLGPMQVILGGVVLGTLMVIARYLRLRGRNI